MPEQRDELARQLQAAASTATVAEPAPGRTHEDATRQTPMPAHPVTVPSQTGVVPPIGRLGKYELLEEIGRGGMGVVYRAVDLELKRTVALKTLLVGDQLRPEAAERLLREARTAAVLDHPGIVPVHDVGTIDGVPFFAMAYLQGRNLDRLLRGNDLPGLRERAAVVSEVARAIAHAHSRNVIHRDLKPSNILIDEAGRVHVMDFGLAKRLDEGERLTGTGQMLGTPHYMPPEQIDGASDRVGAASDVYAIGAILYECLTGQPPFSGGTLAEIVARALRSEPTPPSVIDRRIHVDLETICLKALDKDPLRRYPDAGAMSADLDRYLKGEAIEARPVGWRERWLRRLMRQKLLTAVATIAILAGAGAGIGAMESARLHSRVRRDLGEKSELYLDAALQLRRAGLPIARAAHVTLPRLQAIVAEADRLDPGRAEPHFHLGRFLRALMDFDGARAAQDTALARNPGLAPARYERAVLTAYAHARRLQVLRERSVHPFDARGTGGTPLPTPPVQNDASLEQQDGTAQDLRARLLADLNRLAADSAASALTSARLACARGLALA
ncbi:MAG: serine/threonine protein kinase, partial [Xanthomonadales bacterium]|nr:serine/threonine protein kinase [Xanthomonadales bacterium]